MSPEGLDIVTYWNIAPLWWNHKFQAAFADVQLQQPTTNLLLKTICTKIDTNLLRELVHMDAVLTSVAFWSSRVQHKMRNAAIAQDSEQKVPHMELHDNENFRLFDA